MSYSSIVSKMRISKSIVVHMVWKWKDDQGERNRPRLGSPRKITQRQDALIQRSRSLAHTKTLLKYLRRWHQTWTHSEKGHY